MLGGLYFPQSKTETYTQLIHRNGRLMSKLNASVKR